MYAPPRPALLRVRKAQHEWPLRYQASYQRVRAVLGPDVLSC